MKLPLLLIFAAAALLAGCAAGPSVRAVSDPQADFASYRSFGFVDPLGTDRNGYRSIVSETLKTATRRQLEARGFTYAAQNPALLVNFNARLDDKMRVSTAPAMGPGMAGFGGARGYYGYRGGLYAPFPVYRDQTSISQYKEGTLNIDVADAAAKRLVWEGVVSGAVTQKTMDNMASTIDTAVAAAFERFPVAVKP
jgi:hypothetical protein